MTVSASVAFMTDDATDNFTVSACARGIDTDTNDATDSRAFGTRWAREWQDAFQGTIFLATGRILEDALRFGFCACRNVCGTAATITSRGANTAASTLNLGLDLASLARRLLVMTRAWSWWCRWSWWRWWRRWWRWSRRRSRLARDHWIGRRSGENSALASATLAAEEVHIAVLAPSLAQEFLTFQ